MPFISSFIGATYLKVEQGRGPKGQRLWQSKSTHLLTRLKRDLGKAKGDDDDKYLSPGSHNHAKGGKS